MIPRRRLFWILLALSAMGLSCSSPDANDIPLTAPGLSTPTAAGLLITTRLGPEVIGVWRNPQDRRFPRNGSWSIGVMLDAQGHSIPRQYEFYTPYPNPSTDSIVLNYDLPSEATEVSLWVVRARFVNDGGTDVGIIGGATISAPHVAAVRTLRRNERLEAGTLEDTWDGRDDDGNRVPPGFYRMYLSVDGMLAWRDILFYDAADTLPPDLKPLVELASQYADLSLNH